MKFQIRWGYLHVFKWTDGTLKLPALPRKVLSCEELGGEAVSFAQGDEGLVLTIKGGKERGLHSVVNLALEDGPEIALIDVEGSGYRKQHGTLVNPMAGKGK